MSGKRAALETRDDKYLMRAETQSMIAKTLVAAILAAAGTLFVLLPTSPLNMPSTFPDSGVFLYAGSHILNGEIPYRDVWDHKPPVIFFLDAFGLEIANGSRWGVWLLEALSLSLSVLIGFRLMRDAFGFTPAIASSFLWLLSLVFVIEGGNLTEEYALPLQFGCLWLAYDAEKRGAFAWRSYLIGLLSGLAFFTKQTTIGIGIAFGIYIVLRRLTFHQGPSLLTNLALLFLGGLTAAIPFLAFFVAHNAAVYFWDAAFAYNFFYSGRSELLRSVMNAVLAAFQALSRTGFTTLALLGWGTGLGYLVLYRKTIDKGISFLMSLALIDLPIELLMVSVSGKQYDHYYMTLLPVFAILTGFLAYLLVKGLAHSIPSTRTANLGISLIVLFSFAITEIQPIRDYKALALSLRQVKSEQVVNYIKAHTSDKDYVLMWGAATTVNFFAHRSAPTRFVYQIPLYTEGYANRELIEEFLGDIVRNKPSLIIDTWGKGIGTNNFGITSPQIEKSLEFIQSNYREIDRIGDWVVYGYTRADAFAQVGKLTVRKISSSEKT